MDYSDDELGNFTVHNGHFTDIHEPVTRCLTFSEWCVLEHYNPRTRTYRTIDARHDRAELLAEYHRIVAMNRGEFDDVDDDELGQVG
jgi:hypothetical protein